jgi:predicted phosphodiesterase
LIGVKESNYLVLSDTHGGKYYIEAVLKQINFRPMAVLFLGDVTADLSVLDKPQYAALTAMR